MPVMSESCKQGRNTIYNNKARTPLHMNDFKSIIDHNRIFEETKYATKLLQSWRGR
jgi:hypothetical protein